MTRGRRAAGVASQAKPGANLTMRPTGGVSSAPQTALVNSKPIQQPQTLILEGYPSQEQQDLLGPNRGSRRWGVAGERVLVQRWVGVEVTRQGIRPVPPPARVVYTFVVPDRGRRDWDNYALIVKPVQDGLVKARVLIGDHYAVLDAVVRFRVERGRRALEITIAPALRDDLLEI